MGLCFLSWAGHRYDSTWLSRPMNHLICLNKQGVHDVTSKIGSYWNILKSIFSTEGCKKLLFKICAINNIFIYILKFTHFYITLITSLLCCILCQIRLESKGGKNSSIMFCTNGILLRILIGTGANQSKMEATLAPIKDAVSEISHIIVVITIAFVYETLTFTFYMFYLTFRCQPRPWHIVRGLSKLFQPSSSIIKHIIK